MSHALWIAKKNQCCVLIKKISDHWGGDDVDWLRDYCKDVIEKNKNDIQKLLDACWDFEAQLKWIPRRVLRETRTKEIGMVTTE